VPLGDVLAEDSHCAMRNTFDGLLTVPVS